MSAAVVGRAGFDVKHYRHGDSGARGDRRGLLYEAHRDLDPEAVRIFAAKNVNIVPSETHKNISMVNDGEGGWRRPTSIQEIIDYGDSRTARVRRKINPKSQTMTTIVAHLPKSMCMERPHPSDSKRSRWVAADPAEAQRYFEELVGYLGDAVLSGGQDAIHGWNVNYDESTPHIQILCDAYGPIPDDDTGALRVDSSRIWYSHRDVRDDQGRQMSGKTKLRRYQRDLRRHMIVSGFPVEAKASDRSLVKLSKGEYERSQDRLREAERIRGYAMEAHEDIKAAEADLRRRESVLAEENSRMDDLKISLGRRESAVAEKAAVLDDRESDLGDRQTKTAELQEQLLAAARVHRAAKDKRQEELTALDTEIDARRAALSNLDTREQTVTAREEMVSKRERDVEARSKSLTALQREVVAAYDHVEKRRNAVAAYIDALPSRVDKLTQKLSAGVRAAARHWVEEDQVRAFRRAVGDLAPDPRVAALIEEVRQERRNPAHQPKPAPGLQFE